MSLDIQLTDVHKHDARHASSLNWFYTYSNKNYCHCIWFHGICICASKINVMQTGYLIRCVYKANGQLNEFFRQVCDNERYFPAQFNQRVSSNFQFKKRYVLNSGRLEIGLSGPGWCFFKNWSFFSKNSYIDLLLAWDRGTSWKN